MILDSDRPNWRSQRTVTVRIPSENLMPGSEEKLKFIAGFPRRLFVMTQVARIQHELSWLVNEISSNFYAGVGEAYSIGGAETTAKGPSLQKILDYLLELDGMPGLFDEPGWAWGQLMRSLTIEPGITATNCCFGVVRMNQRTCATCLYRWLMKPH